MDSKPIWWEKTVEYSFILAAQRDRGIEFAAPLAGVQEAAADAIFAADSKIILVEFKRSAAELNSERDKFEDFDGACDALRSEDHHHFLVYGSVSATNSTSLSLHARRYFSGIESDNVLAILDCGKTVAAFKAYMEELLCYRKTDGRSTGTVGPEAISVAIGISANQATSISLSEYYRIAYPISKPTYVVSNSRSSYGPGM